MTRAFDSTFSLMLDAASFAARAHHGQLRKDGKTPYASHPFRVCLIVRDLFGFDDPRMLMAALLHDTIEDTTTDFDDVAEKFGREVAEWAALLSKDKRLPEEAREEAYIEGLRTAPWQVKMCKLGDVFDNLQDIAQLPCERRAHTLDRVTRYFEALKESASLEMQRSLALVGQAIERGRETINR